PGPIHPLILQWSGPNARQCRAFLYPEPGTPGTWKWRRCDNRRPANPRGAIVSALEPSMTDTRPDPRHDPSRSIRAPRGSELTCRSWLTEAAYRMIQNNLDPDVAERPEDLVVYGGIGRAARDWASYDAILASLRNLGEI